MLAGKHRLQRKRDFQRVYRHGRRISGSLLTLRWFTTSGSLVRVGVVVSKKVSKRAVDRNRLKRQLRESVRELLSTIPNGQDIVITLSPRAVGQSYSELTQQLTTLCNRAKLATQQRTKRT